MITNKITGALNPFIGSHYTTKIYRQLRSHYAGSLIVRVEIGVFGFYLKIMIMARGVLNEANN